MKASEQGESAWTRRICQEMRDCGAKVIALVASKRQIPGLPDRHVSHVAILPIGGMWLEFKDSKTKVKTDQKLMMRDMKLRGDRAYVVRRGSQDAGHRWPIYIEDEDGGVISHCEEDTGESLLRALGELGDLES